MACYEGHAMYKKLTPEMWTIIINELVENNKATARHFLIEKSPELKVTISTVKHQCQALGYVGKYEATLLPVN